MNESEYLQLLISWEGILEERRVRDASCNGVRIESLRDAPPYVLTEHLQQLSGQGWKLVSSIAPSERFELYLFQRRSEQQPVDMGK